MFPYLSYEGEIGLYLRGIRGADMECEPLYCGKRKTSITGNVPLISYKMAVDKQAPARDVIQFPG